MLMREETPRPFSCVYIRMRGTCVSIFKVWCVCIFQRSCCNYWRFFFYVSLHRSHTYTSENAYERHQNAYTYIDTHTDTRAEIEMFYFGFIFLVHLGAKRNCITDIKKIVLSCLFVFITNVCKLSVLQLSKAERLSCVKKLR